MKSKLFSLAAILVLVCLQMVGVAAVSATERQNDPQSVISNQGSPSKPASRDLTDLSEREKWKLARDAYGKAQREERRKDTESAAYYYEAALELLGNLNLASIDLPTHRVLEFQRKVLNSYDRFVLSIESLPSSAGPTAVLEAPIPGEEPEAPDSNVEESIGDRGIRPVMLDSSKTRLPSVRLDMNKRVAGQINFFSNKGRNVMMRWMERAASVFPRLRPILQEEGIPEEVMYLAMVESGLNPRAYSYAHAAGVWQFIPSTGRIFGLNVDKTYDERLHIEEATRAACRYLRQLYDEFGDWYLVFAAYNCGEARVERELNRSRKRDYWALSRLPRQTRNYVPAYLAARAICEDPERYGFPKRPADVPFTCETVWVNGSYRLDDIAASAGHDGLLVKELNPEYVRGVTPGNGKYMVRLPGPPKERWDAQLASRPQTVLPQVAVHEVRRGETLKTISRKYGVSVADIKAVPENRGLSKKLKAGQQVIVPLQTPALPVVQNPETVPAQSRPVDPKPQVSLDHTINYTVHRGESLGNVSRQLGVSVDEICRQNRIKDPDRVFPGQRLKIVITGGPLPKDEAQDTGKPQTYTVQPGDTLVSIARKHGQEPEDLMKLNKLRSNTVYPGQELIISAH